MLLTWNPEWNDPSSAWQAKANRAKEHLDALHDLVETFRESRPYTLTPEKTDSPNRLAYRLRYNAAPVAISTTVGDILHNLRAALESLAFELALRSQGGSLTAAQEAASTFPICKSPDEFDKFVYKKQGLFNERAFAALRAAQPFLIREEGQKLGVQYGTTWDDDARWSTLHRLNTLWNIDKHRRLIPMLWWPDLIYWGSNGPSNRVALPGDGTLEDGSVLLYIEGHDEGMGNDLNHEFNLVLTDDPAFSRDQFGAQEVAIHLV